MIKIQFPIVMYLDGVFVVDGEHLLKMGGKFQNDRLFTNPENLRRKQKNGWILDYNGAFIELTAIGKSKEWLRPVQFLWNFVRSDYQVVPPRSITAGELAGRISAFPAGVRKSISMRKKSNSMLKPYK